MFMDCKAEYWMRYEVFPYEELRQSQSNFHWFLVDLVGSPESEHQTLAPLPSSVGARRGRAGAAHPLVAPTPSLPLSPSGQPANGPGPPASPPETGPGRSMCQAAVCMGTAGSCPAGPVQSFLSQGRPALEWTALGLQAGPHQGALSSHCARLFPAHPGPSVWDFSQPCGFKIHPPSLLPRSWRRADRSLSEVGPVAGPGPGGDSGVWRQAKQPPADTRSSRKWLRTRSSQSPAAAAASHAAPTWSSSRQSLCSVSRLCGSGIPLGFNRAALLLHVTLAGSHGGLQLTARLVCMALFTSLAPHCRTGRLGSVGTAAQRTFPVACSPGARLTHGRGLPGCPSTAAGQEGCKTSSDPDLEVTWHRFPSALLVKQAVGSRVK